MARSKTLMLVMILATLVLLVQCSGEKSEQSVANLDPAKDFQETMDAWDNAEGEGNRNQRWIDFLERHPNNAYTLGTIEFLANTYYLKEQNDPEGAIAFARENIAKITDEKLQARADILLINLYGKTGNREKLRELAAEMQIRGELKLDQHQAFAEAAISSEDWKLASEHCEILLERNTADTIRAEAGTSDLSEDQINNSQLGYKGRALMNLGRALMGMDEIHSAVMKFEEVGTMAKFNYAGIPSYPFSELDQYLSRAYLKDGAHEMALGTIAAEAVIQEDKKALEIMKEAYLAGGRDEASLESFIESTRKSVAKKMPGFSVYDYNGKKVSYDNVKGEVTLLSFWFPT